VKQLVQPSTRNVLDLTGDWYFAENQRLGNLEFFNRIGQLQTFKKGIRPLYCWKLAPFAGQLQDLRFIAAFPVQA